MGACNIGVTFDGKLTQKEVLIRINEIREDNREENGHRDGYSGDWQTIWDIQFKPFKKFNSYFEAEEYCTDKADKCQAIAVKFTDKNGVEKWCVAGWARE